MHNVTLTGDKKDWRNVATSPMQTVNKAINNKGDEKKKYLRTITLDKPNR